MPRLQGHEHSSLKRCLDVVLGLAGLVVLSPVVIACMAAIALTSPGPAMLLQPRVGRHGRLFRCAKLRTMHWDTAVMPSHFVAPSAVTPLGAHLRRLKLDEIPQLWNVLRGEMSLVGPRPCLPTQTQLIEARGRCGLDRIRPGITGIAQVAGVDMSDPERLAALDAIYLDRASLGLDLKVIWQTLFGLARKT